MRATKPEFRPTLLDSVFARVAERARQYVSGLKDTFDPKLAEELNSFFSRTTSPAIDYDRYALAFTYTYFLTNYWKACSALSFSAPPAAHRVTDAGSGSGATGIACLSYLSALLGTGRWTIEITFIDRCPIQLQLARTILEIIRPELPNLEIVGVFECRDLRYRIERRQDGECVLLGHVLTENSPDVPTIIDQGCQTLGPDGRLLIIERTDDPIWGDIGKYLSSQWQRFESAGAIAVVPEQPGFYRPGSDTEVRYLALLSPHRAVLPELLRTYFAAWERRSVELLDQVFTHDAEYVEKPLSRILIGLAEIKEYWRSVVARQENLSVDVHHVMYSDDEGLAEWTALFDYEGRHITLKGVLIIKVRPGSSKVYSLREYFRTQEAPVAP